MPSQKQGKVLPSSRQRPTWRTGPQSTRGGRYIDIEIEGAEISDATLAGPAISTATITEEDWTAPSLLNSWVNYAAGYQAARYRKDSNGIVHIEGTIKTGTTTAGTVLFALPAAYRPPANLIFAGMTYTGGGGAMGAFRLDVESGGNVVAGYGIHATIAAINCSFSTV